MCFDLFTLFDPRSIVKAAEAFVPDGAAELCEAWRSRQFEYAFIRAASARYIDFRAITADALVYASRARGLELSAHARNALVDAYSRLALWPDSLATLTSFREQGLRLAPLANYSRRMLDALLEQAGIGHLFEVRISTELAGTFKPDPRAYALGPALLNLDREEIVFAAFGGWDAAGARWFGFRTFWVNRLGLPGEQLWPGPDAQGPDLARLAAFVGTMT